MNNNFGYQELKGKLFQCGGMISFTNEIKSFTKIIFLGGLGDNILSITYIGKFNEYCIKNNIELIIPQLRSQPNYGIYSLDDDLEDIDKLLSIVYGKIILFGHSTGCQNIIGYLKKYGKGRISCAILQAPVSDVEYEEKINKKLLELINDCEKNRDKIFNYKKRCIRAERFLSLYKRHGEEDMFSTYLSKEHYENLNATGLKLLILISEKDEYAIKNTFDQFKSVKNSTVKILKNSNHGITDIGCQNQMIDYINEFIYDLLPDDKNSL